MSKEVTGKALAILAAPNEFEGDEDSCSVYDESDSLPFDGWLNDFRLLRWYDDWEEETFYVLHDRFGEVLHTWPGEYIPSLTELREIITEALQRGYGHATRAL